MIGIARHDGSSLRLRMDRLVATIEAEAAHAGTDIRPVAAEAVVGQNRPDFPVEVHAGGSLGRNTDGRNDNRGSQTSQGRNPGFHPHPVTHSSHPSPDYPSNSEHNSIFAIVGI